MRKLPFKSRRTDFWSVLLTLKTRPPPLVENSQFWEPCMPSFFWYQPVRVDGRNYSMKYWIYIYQNILKRNIYPLLFIALGALLAWANYTPGTFLTGWDTLHPEFNFGLAFDRMLNGVWRIDQGLGAVAIQSHMADLPRVLFLWIASLTFPLNTLRYLTFFGALIAGPVGAYYLTRYFLRPERHQKTFAAFLAGLAYLCNLATVQHFAVPLEMFAVQYALLPWLLLVILSLLEHPTHTKWIFLAILTLLATPQAQTATLFYTYLFGLGLLLISYIALHLRHMRILISRSAMIVVITIAINSFWLLPNIYAVITQGDAVRNSKVNQLFSEDAFRKNQLYGTWKDVLILKNFLYNWRLIDPETLEESEVLAPWIQQLKNPLTQGYLWMLPIFTITGIFLAWEKNQRQLLSFVLPIFVSYLFLANNQWPAKQLIEAMREHVPLLREALRFPFTKFSILLLTMSIPFIGLTISWLMGEIRERLARIVLCTILIALPLYAFIPAFKGNLINPAMRINVPSYYFNVFDWFASQDIQGRVALLPAQSFWNWTNYRWGYQGSGFLQFGIPQPILDRDYDRWSPKNENYYWELSRAIYTKNEKELEMVFRKYAISYVVLDTAVISRDNNRALYLEELTRMLSSLSQYRLTKQFGTVSIYSHVAEIPQLTLTKALPHINAYAWNDNDVAYSTFGNYITEYQNSKNDTIIFPFRSLFTKRDMTREFHILEDDRTIRLESVFTSSSSLMLDKKEATVFTSDFGKASFEPCGGSINGQSTRESNESGDIRLQSIHQRGCLTLSAANLPLDQGYLVAISSRHIQGIQARLEILNATAKHMEIQTNLPTSNDWITTYYTLPPLAKDHIGYTVYISNDGMDEASINDIKSVIFYKLPYQKLISTSLQSSLDQQGQKEQALVYQEAYHPGWHAYVLSADSNQFAKSLPFLFGIKLTNHVEINNWANGWTVPTTIQNGEIIELYFLPQLLEWVGLSLSLLTFIIIVAYKKL